MIEPYAAMAPIYDQMNRELDYAQWADFVEAQFSRFTAEKPSLVLDLAAGSGPMTAQLAKRGYDMIAVDRSGEMLSLAADRMASEGLTGVLLLQALRDLRGSDAPQIVLLSVRRVRIINAKRADHHQRHRNA